MDVPSGSEQNTFFCWRQVLPRPSDSTHDDVLISAILFFGRILGARV